MDKKQDLTARNFPTAEEDADAVVQPSRYAGPESAYRLAFTDTEFLLREELRPVRMQLELLKPELVQLFKVLAAGKIGADLQRARDAERTLEDVQRGLKAGSDVEFMSDDDVVRELKQRGMYRLPGE